MSWAEEQDWFGLEDLALQYETLDSETLDPKEEIKHGNWICKDGTVVPICNMTYTHLINSIKMIEEGRLKRNYALPYLKFELKTRI